MGNLISFMKEVADGLRESGNYGTAHIYRFYDRRNDKTENPDRPWTVVGDDGKYYYYGNFDWYDYYDAF